MFVCEKVARGHLYLYLVESVREGKRVTEPFRQPTAEILEIDRDIEHPKRISVLAQAFKVIGKRKRALGSHGATSVRPSNHNQSAMAAFLRVSSNSVFSLNRQPRPSRGTLDRHRAAADGLAPQPRQRMCQQPPQVAEIRQQRGLQGAVVIQQSYTRVAKRAALMAARYAHAKQFKRMNRELKFLRTRLGRLIRDIDRKTAGDKTLEAVFAIPLGKAMQIRSQQQRRRGQKLYSWHAPETECQNYFTAAEYDRA